MNIVLNIKGRDWNFVLVPDKRFDRLYNQGESEHVAMTLPATYEVHFRKSNWDLISVRHEILHILYSMSLVSSTDMSPDDVQELCAEIVGHHTPDIVLWSDRIAERFFGRE